jgi:hypothetical protein
MQHHQHVIDWWRLRDYEVTVLSDGSLLCISKGALLEADPRRLSDAIRRLHRARLRVINRKETDHV